MECKFIIRCRSYHLYVFARLQLSGTLATQEIADRIKNHLEDFWSEKFSDPKRGVFQIRTYVDMLYTNYETQPLQYRDRVQMLMYGGAGPSHVDNYQNSDTYMRLNFNPNYPISHLDLTVRHEFGHVLWLGDKYIEKESDTWARLRGEKTKNDVTIAPGWEGNVMACGNNPLELKNIDLLIDTHVKKELIFQDDGPLEVYENGLYYKDKPNIFYELD